MKNILVTGAGSGLGYELTRLNALEGSRVFALDRDINERLLSLEKSHPALISAIECDIGSTRSVNAALEIVAGEVKRLDRIYNNAGIHRFEDWTTLEDTDLDFCKVMFDINAVGPLRIVKAALPLLGCGSVIINTSSEAASIANTNGIINYAYSMSKAGMNMGAKIMDNWLIGRGIRTIMIHPGRMRTAMRGAHSDTNPWDTASELIKLAERVRSLPEEAKYMDYKGNPINW